MTFTVSPSRTWITGPGEPPANVQPVYLTPGAISSVTSDSGIVYSWTVPGPTGGSTGSYCALDSVPCAVEPTGVWCAVWSGTVAAAACGGRLRGRRASGAAGSAAAVAGAASAGTLDEGLEARVGRVGPGHDAADGDGPDEEDERADENGAESGGHRTLLEVRASIDPPVARRVHRRGHGACCGKPAISRAAPRRALRMTATSIASWNSAPATGGS